MLVKILILVCALQMPNLEENQDELRSSPKNFAGQWANAFNSNDPAKLLKFYEQSEKLDVRLSSGLRVNGFEPLKKLYEEEFPQVEFFQSEVKDVTVRTFDKTAVVSFEHHFKFEIPDETKLASHIQTVMVLRKTANRWCIVNEHSSTILDVPRLTPIEE